MKKQAERTVLHCDCNSFFASVEAVDSPSLQEVPMAVAGDKEARHGIILAKNELAKKYGVKTAETIWSAKRKCPSLVLVPPHHEKYALFSARVRRIYERYTDLVEPFGMDEAWLDVTGSKALFGDGYAIAESIRQAVKEEIGITVSVGVSFNKTFAKLGSDYKKPDAVTVISRENYRDIVFPLPVDSLLFIGKQTAEALLSCNIRTVGDLAMASPAFLRSRFGKVGEQLYLAANGEENSPVASIYDKTDAKSVGNGMTFCRDISTHDEWKLGIYSLAEDVAHRLRKQKMQCTTVSVTVRTPNLKTFSKQKGISPATNIAREIAERAMEILEGAVTPGSPIRMLTVTAMNLVKEGEGAEQMDFFGEDGDPKREKTARLETAVEGIRSRFGHGAMTMGAVLGNDIGIDGGKSKRTAEEDGKGKK
ncbi:MAG: DNA polymerase IV [Clostridia bacterium]|nr:DNA polymerase IV [Clostridia bacterium]